MGNYLTYFLLYITCSVPLKILITFFMWRDLEKEKLTNSFYKYVFKVLMTLCKKKYFRLEYKKSMYA